VEKLTKALLLSSGLFPIEQVRKIKLNSRRGYDLLAQKMLKHLTTLGGSKGDLIATAIKDLELRREAKEKEIAKLPHDAIMDLVNAIDATAEERPYVLSEIASKLRDRVHVRKIAFAAGLKGAMVETCMDDIAEASNSGIVVSMIPGPVAHVPFLLIALTITHPHEAFARYSDLAVKPRDYRMSLDIGEATPYILNRLNEIACDMNSLLNGNGTSE